MCQEAERLCQAPGRECVRAEAGVDECQPACQVVVGQVGEVVAKLHRLQHTFIYDALSGKRHHVEIFPVRYVGCRHPLLDPFADDVEFQFQCLLVVASGDEHLLDIRFRVLCVFS